MVAGSNPVSPTQKQRPGPASAGLALCVADGGKDAGSRSARRGTRRSRRRFLSARPQIEQFSGGFGATRNRLDCVEIGVHSNVDSNASLDVENSERVAQSIYCVSSGCIGGVAIDVSGYGDR